LQNRLVQPLPVSPEFLASTSVCTSAIEGRRAKPFNWILQPAAAPSYPSFLEYHAM
jgi:hypothetical protein